MKIDTLVTTASWMKHQRHREIKNISPIHKTKLIAELEFWLKLVWSQRRYFQPLCCLVVYINLPPGVCTIGISFFIRVLSVFVSLCYSRSFCLDFGVTISHLIFPEDKHCCSCFTDKENLRFIQRCHVTCLVWFSASYVSVAQTVFSSSVKWAW